MDLGGLTVLVTRPAGRADALLAAIRAAGGEPRHVPLLAVVPLDPAEDAAVCAQTRRRVMDLDRYRRVIAISVNAVHYGVDWIAQYWPQLPVGIDWYGIGAATVAALTERDIAARSAADNSTEGLLALPELQHPEGERILILRGVGGRETLAQTLAARGARVDYAECYRRRQPQLDSARRAALWQPPADVVLVNSGETLVNLWHYLPEPGRRLYCARPLLVPSARVAAQARALGFARVLVAADAGTAATLAALQKAKDSKQ